MDTRLLISIAVMAYSGFQFFSAKAGGKLDSLVSTIVINIVAVVVPLALLLAVLAHKNPVLATQKSGLLYAGLAGMCIAIFTVAFQKTFQQGANLSYISPIVFGGAIAFSTILSLLFLKESVSVYHVIGIILVLAGIVFISLAKTS